MTTGSNSALESGARAARALKIVESMPAFAWSADPDGRFTYISPNTLAYLGTTQHDLDLLSDEDEFGWRQVVHPDDYDRVAARWRHCIQTGEHYDTEHRIRGCDGAYRWFRNSGRPSRNNEGEITAWYGTTIDIEEQKQAEAALRDRERELSQFVDLVPSHLWRLNPKGEPTFFNRQMIDFIGFDIAETDKMGVSGIDAVIGAVHPDDANDFEATLRRCLVTGESFAMQYRLRRSDGIYRWMSSRAQPMRDESGRIIQWYGLCHDVDDQNRLYSDLEEREAKIRRLVDSDIIGIVIWDLDGRLIDANDAFLGMVGYEREDLQAGLRWFDMTPPEWQDAHAHFEAEELRTTGKMQAREKEFFRKDGSRVPVLIGAACFEGESSQGVAYILDLTKRKRAEGALRDRERELAQLVDIVPVHIRRLAPDGEPTFFNKRLIDFLGLDVADLGEPGMRRSTTPLHTLVHPDDAADVRKTVDQSLAVGEPYAMKYRIRRADGTYRWVDGRAVPVRDESGTIVQWYSVSFDIDDQVHAQEALREREEELHLAQEKVARASQAASLAELSASIAHEVNQPLAAVVANSHACQRWLATDPPNLERAGRTVERIIRDANAASDVVSRIRALFKQAIDLRSHAALQEVIAEARDLMAEETARSRVRMEIDLEDDLPLIAFDRIQLQQVFVNLIRNGVDAMDGTSGDKVLRIRVYRVGDVIQIQVSDLGSGIAFPEKIFEPFFTSKENGMGMGLAICRSIVESHGGRLWVENNEPRGAKFAFTLPIDVKAAS
ncbi:MAG TPA: PAS domain-containing protein [Pseudolabrys sp.]|nr:PAS domain-containing protein [Pseudolabrys sp.]